MSSDIVLTSALRTNLLSLQNTQSLIDKTQLRLATGLKVNSALDNPQSFFASEGLKNRANDLSLLLDGIGQGISAIKTADEGAQSLTTLIDQAESLADSARAVVGDSGAQASITGTRVFTGSDNIVSTAGIDNADTITFSFVDEDGKTVAIDANSGEGAGGVITFSSNETVDEVIAQINGIKDNVDGEQLVKAELTSEGYLKLTSLSGGDFRVQFSDNGVAGGLGFGDIGDEELSDVDGAFTADQFGFNVSSTPVLASYSLVKNAAGDIADRTTTLTSAQFADPNSSGTLTDIIANDSTNDRIVIGINGATITTSNRVVDDAATETIQDLVDGINNNTTLNTDIRASYNEDTGQIEIRALNDNVKSVQIGVEAVAAGGAFTLTDGLGFGTGNDITATADADFNASAESIVFGAGAGQLAQIETDYDTVREQIDQLVSDSSYRGTNLLSGDDLTVFFNEDRDNSLTVRGDDLSTGTNGLDITAANFGSLSQIESALAEVRSAKDTVRNFSSSLATSLNVLQTREDFTQNLINTLQEGSDKLVVADQNEEGANLLALQTRQTLGVTSLSLASQSQQAVLRLF